MKAWVLTDENGRVTAMAISGKLDAGTETDLPEGYDPERQQDWRLVSGQWVHDPVPIVHDVTLEEQVAALSEAVMGLLMGGNASV